MRASTIAAVATLALAGIGILLSVRSAAKPAGLAESEAEPCPEPTRERTLPTPFDIASDMMGVAASFFPAPKAGASTTRT